MIVSIYLENDSFIHSKDEKKLLEIEKKENIVFESKSSYNNITILNTDMGRILLFEDTYQGGIINYNGFKGGMPYTRYYHLANVINEKIQNILVLGLGSGSILLDILKTYDCNLIDAVEIDPIIIELAHKYFDLPENGNFNIHCEDAIDFVYNTKNKYDFIIVDIFVSKGMPYKFMTREFIQKAHSILKNNGVIGVNLFGTEDISEEINAIFRSEYKTYSSIFNTLYCFPVLYGAYEFYRYSCNLRYKLGSLTNVVLLATKAEQKISKTQFIQKARALMKSTKLNHFKNFDLYARDYYEKEISTKGVKILTNNFDSDLDYNQFQQLIQD